MKKSLDLVCTNGRHQLVITIWPLLVLHSIPVSAASCLPSVNVQIHVFLIPLAKPNSYMSFSLLQPSFLMSKTRSYAQILIVVRVAPLDFQQGVNFVCTFSCGSDEYSCLYHHGYKHFFISYEHIIPFFFALLELMVLGKPVCGMLV
ncbi:hypothetical protein H5410_013384 [Solanum commersonii]|uniref:Uncharacterized protein n=1 Tax=Solanum commersonii TaxID=4109 RepID=A0A9J6AUF9_SOLCO|nr:hypothetical protein H5410_013384 [Solanum commersonii]